MSLLADLLSKVKHEEQKVDIPPNLIQVVLSSRKGATRKRVVLLGIASLVMVLAGFATLHFLEGYSAKTRLAGVEQQPAVKPSAPPAPARVAETVSPPEETRSTSTGGQEEQKSARPNRTGEPIPGKRQEQAPAQASIKRSATGSSGSAVPKERDVTGRAERDAAIYEAKTYESAGDYHHAILSYKKALEYDPSNYLLTNNLSSLLIRLGRFGESADYARRTLAVKKEYGPALINLGIALIETGRPSEGLDFLLKAASFEPGSEEILLNLGLAYERLGNSEKALTYFSRLADQKNVQGYLGMGRIYEKTGRSRDAEQVYRTILSADGVDGKTKRFAAERLNQLAR